MARAPLIPEAIVRCWKCDCPRDFDLNCQCCKDRENYMVCEHERLTDSSSVEQEKLK